MKKLTEQVKINYNFYSFKGKEGLLIEVDECKGVEPLEIHNDIGFFSFKDLSNNILLDVMSGNISVYTSYTASYNNMKGDGEDIGVYEMVNIENHQKMGRGGSV